MMKQTAVLLAVCGILAGICVAMRPVTRLKVTSDKENVVASRLEGKWRLHTKLTERLTGRKVRRGEAVRGFVFENDSAVAATIPEKYEKFLKDKQIFMAGTIRFLGQVANEKAKPFILIQYKGNPRVLYFRQRDGDPMGDSESFNLVIAVAKDKAKDLLFIGGDFNNQPFSAFVRVPNSPEPDRPKPDGAKTKVLQLR